MISQTRSYTIDQFDDFVKLPENRERLFEYIGGEIVEVVSNPYSSKIGSRINAFLGIYLLQNDIGHLTGADGGYMVSGERYIPDVAFISYKKQPELSYIEGYVPVPPDLAVEVLSPGNKEDEIAVKVANYLAAGTMLVMVRPMGQQVLVFRPGKPVQHLDIDGVLDGGSVLPGFTLAVKDIFPAKPSA